MARIGSITVNEIEIIEVDSAPSGGAGIAAADGSIAIITDGSAIYTKTGAGDTAWTRVDKTFIGLGNVDDTSDVNKPVSTAQQTALNLKANSLLTGLVVTNSSDVVATDSVLVAIGKLQGQSNLWKEFIKTTASVTNSSNTTVTNVTELQFTAIAGKQYYLEYTIMFRSAATGTGFGVTLATSDTAAGTISCQVNTILSGDGTSALYTGAVTSLGDLVISTTTAATATDYICTIKGIFVCTTGGTILPQFRSEVNGSAVTFSQYSTALIREF